MARIAGVDIPRNKQVWVSLQYIYGIGSTSSHRILTQTGISPDTKVGNLTDEIIDDTIRNPFNPVTIATIRRSGVSPLACCSVMDKVLYGVSSPILPVMPR